MQPGIVFGEKGQDRSNQERKSLEVTNKTRLVHKLLMVNGVVLWVELVRVCLPPLAYSLQHLLWCQGHSPNVASIWDRYGILPGRKRVLRNTAGIGETSAALLLALAWQDLWLSRRIPAYLFHWEAKSSQSANCIILGKGREGYHRKGGACFRRIGIDLHCPLRKQRPSEMQLRDDATQTKHIVCAQGGKYRFAIGHTILLGQGRP